MNPLLSSAAQSFAMCGRVAPGSYDGAPGVRARLYERDQFLQRAWVPIAPLTE